MKITVLADNLCCAGFDAEWGLSLHIAYHGKNILLDAGASSVFADNAARLGLDLKKVDLAVLSHAHFDHSDGMDCFFEINEKAPFWLRRGAKENCYARHPEGIEYIGIRPGTLKKYAARIRYADGDAEIAPGVWLIPHKLPHPEEAGRAAEMFTLVDGEYRVETFAHEQSLVFRTEQGLVICNSCSHAGADHILDEIAATFPGEKLYALVGGFHLFKTPDDSVRALALRLKESGVAHVITGHCTGDRAFEILKEELGDRALQMAAGLEIGL